MSSRKRKKILGNRYILKSELGRGGMGVVYQAMDRLTRKEVALKQVFAPTTQLRFSSYDPQATLAVSLAQEFKILSSLRHPNIISVIDYGFDRKRQPYFVMDLLDDAETLYDAAWESSEDVKINLILQILQALVYCHQRGVIHRDLKPDNILVVTTSNQVKVMDFGLSITLEDDLTTHDIAGTVEYIAPEIYLGQVPTSLSDLYAVGVIGYELFTGDYLYDNTNRQAIIGDILYTQPDLSKIQNAFIADVLAGLLDKNPAMRYADARQAISAFANATNQPVPQETIAIRESFLQAATLIGREKELDKLSESLDRATMGKGSALLIGGESGVGKSRLLEELRTISLVNGVLVLRGETNNAGNALYQTWRSILRWLSLVVDLTDEEAGILKTVVPDISSILERDIPNPPEIDAAFAQERLLTVIEKLFLEQKEQPMLIILEDLHWAGSETITLLNRLIPFIQKLPILVVATYRDDELAELPDYIPAMNVMKLNRLSKTSIAELAVAMLGTGALQPKLLELLQHETEGNVFFLVEVLRALAEETGKLDRVGQLPVPDQVFAGGVEQVIMRRLSHVPNEVLPILQVAAAIGRTIDYKLMEQLQGSDFEIENWLLLCSDAAILEVQDNYWRFAHDKLRDAILRNLHDDHKSRIHEQIATAIETVYMYAPDYNTALAYHWLIAGNEAKEETYAALAGKQALESGAYKEAIRYLERAYELNQQAAELSDKKMAMLTQQLGAAYLGLENHAEAQQYFERSLQISKDTNYRWGIVEALNDLGTLAFLQNDHPAAQQHLYEALASAMEIRAQKVALSILVGIANLLSAQGDKSRAVTLATLALYHVATDRNTADRAERLITDISQQLSDSEFDQAHQIGKTKMLREVVNELLT